MRRLPALLPSFPTTPPGLRVALRRFGAVGLGALAATLGLAAGAASASPPVPLGTELHVNSFTTGYQTRPTLDHDPTGSFVVVWRSDNPGGVGQDGDGAGIFGQRFDSAGERVAAEFRVNELTTSNQSEPSVAVAPDGSFVSVWSSSHADGSGEGVFGRRFSASGDPVGGEFPVNTFTTSNQRFPHVSQDPRGEGFVVTWSSFFQDGDSYGVFAQRFDALGTRIGGEFRVHDSPTGGQAGSASSHAASGDFVVVWSASFFDPRFEEIYARRFDSGGGPIGAEFRVNAYTTQSQTTPAVSHGPGGDFVVTWSSYGQDGSASGVFGRRYDAAGNAGPELQVTTYTTGHQAATVSAVSHGSDGTYTVTWESAQDGSNIGVYLQSFAADGSPLGGEMLVNTYTPNIQSIPAVSADPTGRFVVAWSSNSQAPDPHRGIFAQRFLLATPVFADGFESGDTSSWSP